MMSRMSGHPIGQRYCIALNSFENKSTQQSKSGEECPFQQIRSKMHKNPWVSCSPIFALIASVAVLGPMAFYELANRGVFDISAARGHNSWVPAITIAFLFGIFFYAASTILMIYLAVKKRLRKYDWHLYTASLFLWIIGIANLDKFVNEFLAG